MTRHTRWPVRYVRSTFYILFATVILLFATAQNYQEGHIRNLSTQDDLRDRIIRDAVRLDQIEEQIRFIQNSGALNSTQTQLAVLRSETQETRDQLRELRNILIGTLLFVATQLVAAIFFAIRFWISHISLRNAYGELKSERSQ